jgi:hypothetical protein
MKEKIFLKWGKNERMKRQEISKNNNIMKKSLKIIARVVK